MTTLSRFLVAFAAFLLAIPAMAIEEAPYTRVESQGKFELREYAPYAIAYTEVEGEFKEVGNEGFRRLVRYISGDNRAQRSISMTAPVEQTAASEKIAMTAPVEQSGAGHAWRIAFVLPATYTAESAPLPTDVRVQLAQMPARRVAAVRYSGTWSRENYETNLTALREWIAQRGLVADGEPVWARYNPPITPWFLRRNEIHIPVHPK